MVSYNNSYEKAQSHLVGYGEGYARRFERRRTKIVEIAQRISKLKQAKIGRPMGKKDTGVETTYGQSQRVMATCQMDRRSRQARRDSLDAGGIGPVTLGINWGGLCSAVYNNRLI